MVDAITSASAAANINALNQIAKARETAAKAIAEFEANKQKKAENKNLQGPSGDVLELQKTVNKSSSNLSAFATDIGVLVKNNSRLNVISTLEKGDRQDHYKFNVITSGEAAFSQLGDPDLRIQVRNAAGTLVADSDESAGQDYENFVSFSKGEFKLEAGQYTINVARKEGASAEEKINFALQLRMGDYKQDFDTVVKQPKAGDDPFSSVQTEELSSMLTESMTTIANFRFGQSATEKLMGGLFGGSIFTTSV